MTLFSIVIICKNEAHIIGRTLQSLQGLTDDIVVFDNGSTDGTQELVKKSNARLIEGAWEGYGKTKRKATSLAKYDWILSLDADEAVDEELKNSLLQLDLSDEKVVYDISFKNFLGNKYLRYGEWGGDHHIRMFNRRHVNYNEAEVHEDLEMPAGIKVRKLKGHVLHQTVKDLDDYEQKTVRYALLNADKYFRQGRKASFFKTTFSPAFTFINYYLLKLGFLDGHAGFICAKMTARYTYLKYARLKALQNKRE